MSLTELNTGTKTKLKEIKNFFRVEDGQNVE